MKDLKSQGSWDVTAKKKWQVLAKDILTSGQGECIQGGKESKENAGG